tara:strand:- start:322 stop:567 length:246 start_codon:yes stop_codon:yes gene_type:complete
VKKYILFIKESCPFCVLALELLEELGLEYSVITVNGNIILAEQVKKAFDWRTFPIVLLQDEDSLKLIGGFTDLESIVINDE